MSDVLKAAQTNDKRATLIAMRDATAEKIDRSDSGRDVAALMRRLMDILTELDATPDPDDDDPVQAMQRRVAKHGRD